MYHDSCFCIQYNSDCTAQDIDIGNFVGFRLPLRIAAELRVANRPLAQSFSWLLPQHVYILASNSPVIKVYSRVDAPQIGGSTG